MIGQNGGDLAQTAYFLRGALEPAEGLQPGARVFSRPERGAVVAIKTTRPPRPGPFPTARVTVLLATTTGPSLVERARAGRG